MQPQHARKIGYSQLAVFGNSRVTEAMYKAIASAESSVPTSALIDKLSPTPHRVFLERFRKAILNGSFDDAGLRFLADGEWIEFDGAFLRAREAVFDEETCLSDYVSNSSMRFDRLLAWAVDENADEILPWGLWHRGLSVETDKRTADGIKKVLKRAERLSPSPAEVSSYAAGADVSTQSRPRGHESFLAVEGKGGDLKKRPSVIKKRGGANRTYDHGAIMKAVSEYYQRFGEKDFSSRAVQKYLREKFEAPCAQTLRNICKPLFAEIDQRRLAKKNCKIKSIVKRHAKLPASI